MYNVFTSIAFHKQYILKPAPQLTCIRAKTFALFISSLTVNYLVGYCTKEVITCISYFLDKYRKNLEYTNQAGICANVKRPKRFWRWIPLTLRENVIDRNGQVLGHFFFWTFLIATVNTGQKLIWLCWSLQCSSVFNFYASLNTSRNVTSRKMTPR